MLDALDTQPCYILQVIATRVRGNPTRSTVLGLNVKTDAEPHRNDAARFIHESLEMLQSTCGVLSKKYVPYRPLLITMAAAWPEIGLLTIDCARGPEIGARRQKLRQWFWCATFAQRYETQGNTRTQNDVPELRSWLTGSGAPLEVTSHGEVRSFRQVSSNTQALCSAVLALSLRNHPPDFHAGQPLTSTRMSTDQIDDHHVFPQAFLPAGMPKSTKDCVLNRTLVDKSTNILISAEPPSICLASMGSILGSETLASVLRSHSLPAATDGPLFADDYETFLSWREAEMRRQVLEVTRWPPASVAGGSASAPDNSDASPG